MPTSRDKNHLWDSLEESLIDTELLAEVDLTTQLIIAANESDEPLCPQQIDRLLGIERQ